MVSLIVESLFTNVHVKETMKIVVDSVYDHSEMDPTKIPPNLVQEIFLTSTEKTSFVTSIGQMYLQKDGCAMESCLAPTLADFYMCHLKNKILKTQPDLKSINFVVM